MPAFVRGTCLCYLPACLHTYLTWLLPSPFCMFVLLPTFPGSPVLFGSRQRCLLLGALGRRRPSRLATLTLPDGRAGGSERRNSAVAPNAPCIPCSFYKRAPLSQAWRLPVPFLLPHVCPSISGRRRRRSFCRQSVNYVRRGPSRTRPFTSGPGGRDGLGRSVAPAPATPRCWRITGYVRSVPPLLQTVAATGDAGTLRNSSVAHLCDADHGGAFLCRCGIMVDIVPRGTLFAWITFSELRFILDM